MHEKGRLSSAIARTVARWHALPKPAVVLLATLVAVFAGLYLVYRLVDPLPPHRLVIAAGIAGTSYDDVARRYAQIFARHGVALEVRNYAGAKEHFDLLRDSSSGVQAAITTFGFTEPRDAATLYSLGGISDSAVFVFYKGAEPWNSPDLPVKSARCHYVTGGGEWHAEASHRSSSGRGTVSV